MICTFLDRKKKFNSNLTYCLAPPLENLENKCKNVISICSQAKGQIPTNMQ